MTTYWSRLWSEVHLALPQSLVESDEEFASRER